RLAAAHADPDRADLPATARALAAHDRDRHDGRAGFEREPADAALRATEAAPAVTRALGEDHEHTAALEHCARCRHRLFVRLTALDRERAETIQKPALPALLEELLLRDEVDRPPNATADHERVEEAAVVGREDDRALLRDVLAPGPLEREA